MKKFIVLLLVVLICFGSLPAFGMSDLDEKVHITSKDMAVLKNEVGMSDEQIARYPAKILAELIEENAVLIKEGKPELRTIVERSDDFTIQSINGLNLAFDVYEVTSTSGRKRFRMLGFYDWQTMPSPWRLTNRVAFGYPETNLWVLPTSGGQVVDHTLGYNHRLASGQGVYHTKTTPTDASVGAGVSTTFPLPTASITELFGVYSQYVETTKSSGYSNVKFEYGYQRLSGTPTISILPAGLSINITSNTDVQSYMLGFAWN